MANIFNLIDEYYQLQREIEALDGEITEELDQKLTINEKELEGKVKAYYSVIRTKESEIDIYNKEIERFQGAIKSRKNLIDRLKKTVSVAVEIFGTIPPKAKQKTLTFDTLKVSNKESDSVVIEDDFENKIVYKEEYEQYYNYSINLSLTPSQYKILSSVLEQETIVAPQDTDETTNDCIKEFIPLSIKTNIIPIKDKIKEFYENRPKEMWLNTETGVEEEREVDPIPGASLSHNLSVQFK
jgi:hypothetical protein